jgi:hypothetical protein
MQQNADLAENTNTFAMQPTHPNPIEFINGQVLELIASLKSTGDQLFEKTHKIDEKLVQVEAQFHQHLHQSSQKIYAEIERSRTLSASSLNEIRQIWKTNGQRALNESISTINGESEKALHLYVNRLETQLTEAKDHHNNLIADFKKQLSNDFENFVKESRHELDTTKKSVNDIFDKKLETLLKSLSDSTKEIDKHKAITERFIEETKVSLQSMVGKFQDQHDDQIYQVSVKLNELESKANRFIETTHSEFEDRWLNMVNTHNENLKSFRDSLKEAVVAKIAEVAKKRLDSIIKEFTAVLDPISKNQEALKLEILSFSKKGQNDQAQIESTIKKLQKELNGVKKNSQIWILFITLIFSSIFIYTHYLKW